MRLGDFNLDREFLEDCNKLSIKLLAFYAKGQLSRQEERLIDIHCINCSHCRGNLAYVFEIIKGRQILSVDQQTLLLKYLQDPIYKQNLEKLKDDIKQEVLTEIKAILLAESLLPKSLSLTNELIKKHFEANPNLEGASTSNIGKVLSSNGKSKKVFVFLKALKAKSKEITNQKLSYSSFVSACLLAVLLSLSGFTYLALNSKSKQQLSISSLSSSQNPIIQNITQQHKQTTTNLYQQLDSVIEQYLTSKNNNYLIEAEFIAKNIKDKYEDNYGVDLVSYYKSVPSSVIEKLLVAHKSLLESFEQTSGDNYQERLDASKNLEKEFLSLGNIIEAYKTKTLIDKLCMQLHKYDEANLVIQDGVKFSTDNKYLFLQLYFLLWKAKYLSQVADFIDAEETFLQVIELANKLSLYKVVNSAGSSLAMSYYQLDENKKAFELSQKSLANFPDYKNTQAISFLQIAGMAAFNLHYYDVSTLYLKEAINNSQSLNNSAFTVRSYSFLALTLSEEKKFDEANNYYLLAEKELKNINDETSKQEALGVIIGYKAKTKLLEQNYNQALEFYQQKLSIINKLQLKNNLEISQINEAMAIALTQLGQNDKAQEHIAIAKNYKNLAEINKEVSNCLLSFVPTNCLTR